MNRFTAAIAATLVIAGFLLVPATSSAESAAIGRPVQILLQDYAKPDCKDCQPLDWLVLSPFLALEDRARMRSLAAQYAVLRDKLPQFDIAAAARAAFCRHLSPDGAPDCAEVTIAGVGDPTRKTTGTENAAGVLLVRLSIEYARAMRANELRMIGAFIDVADPKSKPTPLLYSWYTTPGTDSTPASPLEPAATGDAAKQRAAQDYWFAGSPSRMEREITAGLETIARSAATAMPKLLTQGSGGADAWLQSLQTIESVKAGHNLKCRGYSCRMQVLEIDAERLSTVQKAPPSLVIMSAPVEAWR